MSRKQNGAADTAPLRIVELICSAQTVATAGSAVGRASSTVWLRDASISARCSLKHVLQKVGLYPSGLKGRVNDDSHLAQTACDTLSTARPALRSLVMTRQSEHLLGRLLSPLAWKNSCSPSVKTKSLVQSQHLKTLSVNIDTLLERRCSVELPSIFASHIVYY